MLGFLCGEMNTVEAKGRVYLVGAGPGRADLVTVRGEELLRTADCVICDKLANPALLSAARDDAEIINVPKRVEQGAYSQQEINQLLIQRAQQGKTVVRLKGGDPFIFGRGAEEARALAEAGIEFEIVPGVTAAVAAGAYAGIILTDRQLSSQVVFVTGHEAEGKEQTNIDWDLLARFHGTIVFYMGMENLDFIAGKLLEYNMPPHAAAAVVAGATLPEQKTVCGRLDSIVGLCRKEEVKPPAVVIIGPGAKADARLDWFTKKPLFGKVIVTTRSRQGNILSAAKIAVRGGRCIEFDTLNVKPLTNSNAFLHALARLSDYHWLIFTSATGVQLFFGVLEKLQQDARTLSPVRVAAIGIETAKMLEHYGIKADFVPNVYTTLELGRGLIDFTPMDNRKVLLLRSQLASDDLPDLLSKTKAIVDDVPIYTLEKNAADTTTLKQLLNRDKIDWITFASPFAVRAFFDQIPVDMVKACRARIASIGPVTAEQIQELGLAVAAEAREHTIDGLLDAIEKSSAG